MQHTALYELSVFLGSAIPPLFWSQAEIFLSILILFLTFWQRSHAVSFKSSSIDNTWRMWCIVKAGQFGLYLNIMMGILGLVDGISAWGQYPTTPPVAFIFCLFSIALVKANLWMFYDKGVAYIPLELA